MWIEVEKWQDKNITWQKWEEQRFYVLCLEGFIILPQLGSLLQKAAKFLLCFWCSETRCDK